MQNKIEMRVVSRRIFLYIAFKLNSNRLGVICVGYREEKGRKKLFKIEEMN